MKGIQAGWDLVLRDFDSLFHSTIVFNIISSFGMDFVYGF